MIWACSGVRANARRSSRVSKNAIVPNVNGNEYQILWPRYPRDRFMRRTNGNQRRTSPMNARGPVNVVAPTNWAPAWPISGARLKSVVLMRLPDRSGEFWPGCDELVQRQAGRSRGRWREAESEDGGWVADIGLR